MVSINSIVVASRQQVSSDLAGEAVILDLKNGMYYGLNAVGAFIWRLIQQPKSVGEIRDAILNEYEVESDHCETDLFALLQELGAVGLVEILDQANSSSPVP